MLPILKNFDHGLKKLPFKTLRLTFRSSVFIRDDGSEVPVYPHRTADDGWFGTLTQTKQNFLFLR